MRLCLRLLPLFCASTLAAQQSSTAGAPDTTAFRRLDLPTPKYDPHRPPVAGTRLLAAAGGLRHPGLASYSGSQQVHR